VDRTAREPSCIVLNAYAHDAGQRRAERYRKKGPLKGVTSVLDRGIQISREHSQVSTIETFAAIDESRTDELSFPGCKGGT